MASKKEIKELEDAINSPATPDAQKKTMRKILEKLKSKPAPKKEKKKKDNFYIGNLKSRIAGLESQRKAVEKLSDKFKETKGGSGRTKAEILKDFDKELKLKKEELAKAEGKPPEKKPAAPPIVEYDCDELIAKEKERRKSRKKSAAKSAKKPAVKKDVETVINLTKRVKGQVEEGELTNDQIKTLINEYQDAINELKKLLKK